MKHPGVLNALKRSTDGELEIPVDFSAKSPPLPHGAAAMDSGGQRWATRWPKVGAEKAQQEQQEQQDRRGAAAGEP